MKKVKTPIRHKAVWTNRQKGMNVLSEKEHKKLINSAREVDFNKKIKVKKTNEITDKILALFITALISIPIVSLFYFSADLFIVNIFLTLAYLLMAACMVAINYIFVYEVIK